MLAAWYERPGPAAEVLEVGAIADLAPGPREVRVCVTVSGINPGDTKKRNDLTICLLGSDDFSREVKQQAAADLTAAARERALRIPIDERLPLQRVAEAHDRVDVGARGRVLLTIPQDS
jgi:NADPH:quinone reductase-like Zn-dependent oxidoreductase